MARIVAILLTLVMLVPFGMAQDKATEPVDAGSDDRPVIRLANITVVVQPSLADGYEAELPDCSGADVLLEGEQVLISETSRQTGCGAWRLNMSAPAGAQAGIVSFLANRVVTFDADSAGQVGTAAADDTIAGGGEAIENVTGTNPYDALESVDGYINIRQYFSANDAELRLFPLNGSSAESMLFSYSFPVVGELTPFTWMLADDGVLVQSNQPNVVGPGAAGTYQNVTVTYPGLPLEIHELRALKTVNGTHKAITKQAVVKVGSFTGVGDANACLSLTLPNAQDLMSLRSPNGTIFDRSMMTIRGENVDIELGHSIDPSGDYVLQFAWSVPLDASVIPRGTDTLPIVPILLLLMPAIVLPGSTRAVQRYRKYASDAKRSANGPMLGWAGAGALYVIGIVLLFWLVTFQKSTQMNWGTDMAVTASLLLAAFVTFLFVWRYAGKIGLTQLRRELDERRRMNEELQRSNKELQTFAYVASHDLQEPLRKVASFTQLLKRRYHGKLESDADEFIDHAVEGARRMQRQIQDLLEYSRADREGEIRSVDFQAIAEEVIEDLEILIQQKGATVTAEGLPTLDVRSRQVRGVFLNLIQNALKFTSPDRKPVITITAVPHGNEWQFEVSDNGIGIEPVFHDRIFDVFQRLHRRDQYEGTGIGLSIVKKVIEHHGGKIWVNSQVGEGTAFIFTLPKEAHHD